MHFVAIAPNQWDGQWMNRQHLMWAVKDHAPVLYAQEPEAWYSGRKPRDERFFRAGLEPKAETLSVLRLPKCLCRRGRQGAWNATVDRWKASLIRRAAKASDGPRILYFWHPELYPYVELLRPDLAIYHVFDRIPEYHEPQFAGRPLYNAFRSACRAADVVVAGTAEQAAIVPNRQAEVVPNGVAYDWYDRVLAEPDDVARIPRPRIGYAGSISKKLDFAWFESLASRSRFHLVLVGPLGNLGAEEAEDWIRLCSLSNVHYLGPKPAAILPAYVKAFDVGLVNYRRGIHSEAASPLKLYEYAAAGLPIIASRMHSLAGDASLADLLRFVDSPDEAASAVEQALRNECDGPNIERRKAFARANSWQQRAQRVVDLALSKLGQSADIALPSAASARVAAAGSKSSPNVPFIKPAETRSA